MLWGIIIVPFGINTSSLFIFNVISLLIVNRVPSGISIKELQWSALCLATFILSANIPTTSKNNRVYIIILFISQVPKTANESFWFQIFIYPRKCLKNTNTNLIQTIMCRKTKVNKYILKKSANTLIRYLQISYWLPN